jgi:hypothetical protein
MASDSPAETGKAARQARQLALALDEIEAQLNDLEPGADPDVLANALKKPILAFNAAAREALL